MKPEQEIQYIKKSRLAQKILKLYFDIKDLDIDNLSKTITIDYLNQSIELIGDPDPESIYKILELMEKLKKYLKYVSSINIDDNYTYTEDQIIW